MNAVKPIESLIVELESQVEKHLDFAIRTFQNLDPALLLKRPDEEGWNITQCLWHLNSYGHFYLPLIQKKLLVPQHKKGFSSGWLGGYFTKMMIPGKQKFKAFKDHVPPDQLDPYEVVAEFIEQQETLLNYLKQAHKADLEQRVPISVSRFITLKLGDVFQFMIQHDERHLQQALRNLGK